MNNTLNFDDLFSSSFIAAQSSLQKISSLSIIINLTMAFIVGMFIFYVYKKTFQGVLYQKSFNVSLVAMSMMTTLIIMTISGNLVLSLGMVGALSIVRFRTPIKDPMDLVFIFWAITVGIANGVGYFNLSIIGSLVITILLLWMAREKSDESEAYLLVVTLPTCKEESELMRTIASYTSHHRLKSKTILNNACELIIELRLKKGDTAWIQTLQECHQTTKATLVSYSSDYVAT